MGSEVEAAEFLGELHGFVDHALLDIVPAQFDETGQRKSLRSGWPSKP